MWTPAVSPLSGCAYLSRLLSTHRTEIYFGWEKYFFFITLVCRCLFMRCFPGFAVTLNNLSRHPESRTNDVMVDNALFVHLGWVGITRCALPQQVYTILHLWPYSTDNVHFSLMLQSHFFCCLTRPEQARAVSTVIHLKTVETVKTEIVLSCDSGI